MTATLSRQPGHLQPAATPRFDMYGAIHKGLRRYMHHTLERIGTLDIGDEADVAAGLDQLERLLAHLRGHLRHENDFVHTAIEARRPGGAGTTADEHVEHLEAIGALEQEVHALRTAPAAQRDARVARLYRHLALFVAENMEHMHGEETANQAVLWAHYSDAELMDIHDRLVASIPPAEMMEILGWMTPALNPNELGGMLADMRTKAPASAYAAMLEQVRGCIDAARWGKVADALRRTEAPR